MSEHSRPLGVRWLPSSSEAEPLDKRCIHIIPAKVRHVTDGLRYLSW